MPGHNLQRQYPPRPDSQARGLENITEEQSSGISAVRVVRGEKDASQMWPRIFKRPKQADKTKIVDIGIANDALRHSYHDHVLAILLLCGDGDYLPLIHS